VKLLEPLLPVSTTFSSAEVPLLFLNLYRDFLFSWEYFLFQNILILYTGHVFLGIMFFLVSIQNYSCRGNMQYRDGAINAAERNTWHLLSTANMLHAVRASGQYNCALTRCVLLCFRLSCIMAVKQ